MDQDQRNCKIRFTGPLCGKGSVTRKKLPLDDIIMCRNLSLTVFYIVLMVLYCKCHTTCSGFRWYFLHIFLKKYFIIIIILPSYVMQQLQILLHVSKLHSHYWLLIICCLLEVKTCTNTCFFSVTFIWKDSANTDVKPGSDPIVRMYLIVYMYVFRS